MPRYNPARRRPPARCMPATRSPPTWPSWKKSCRCGLGTRTSSAANGSPPPRGVISTISARPPGRSSVKSRDRRRRMWSVPSMPRTLPRTSGGARRWQNGRKCSTRSPTAWSSTCRSSRRWRPTTTASPSAKPMRPTCRSRWTTSATSRVACARRKVLWVNSTTTPSPTITMSRSASSARSFLGIFRF